MFNIFSDRDFRLNYANNENILCNRGLTWQSSKVNALNHCVGSSNTSTRIQRILLKLATVCSDWDFQHILCLHSNFRLRTLGVPVSYSDSREASRNSLMPRSSKLKLRNFFFTVTFTLGNYNSYIGISNAITRILRTFSKFP